MISENLKLWSKAVNPKESDRRPPPLTEPERNAVWSVPTVTNSRTAQMIHRRSAIVAFLSEPVKGKPPEAVAASASGSKSKNSSFR